MKTKKGGTAMKPRKCNGGTMLSGAHFLVLAEVGE